MTRQRRRAARNVLSGIIAVVLVSGAPGARAADLPSPGPAGGASVELSVPVTAVVSRSISQELSLPAELVAYRDVTLYPRIQGFVDWMGVDRGSVVHRGDVLIRLVAPELVSRRAEADAHVRSVHAQALEAQAKLSAEVSTFRHLEAASRTAGVIAGNDLQVARATMEASKSRVQSWWDQERSAREGLAISAEMESYRHVLAPFDGTIVERHVHEGSLVGPPLGSSSESLLRISQMDPLRLVVPIPEAEAAGVVLGSRMTFSVLAFPDRTFHGVVSRSAHALDPRTRTMPVELDVSNVDGALSPGMYAQVRWQIRRAKPELTVPVTAIVTTTERTFVITVRRGRAKWVDVRRGTVAGDQVEIHGDLDAGDVVVWKASDEIRNDSPMSTQGAAEMQR